MSYFHKISTVTIENSTVGLKIAP